MDTLDGIKTIVAVVETGSFTAAGERLGISKALVSKYVGQVEEQLNCRLFNRSTRRIALTEAGDRYYHRALPLLEEYSSLVESVDSDNREVSGTLRISTTVTFGVSHLSKTLHHFLEQYPNVNVDLHLNDKMVNMVEEGIDLVIRFGSVDDSSLIARKISETPLVLVAAPDYLETQNTPTEPEHLLDHQCIVDSNFRVGSRWPITRSDGSVWQQQVPSRISVNNPQAVAELVKNGQGIGFCAHFVVREALENGELIEVLPNLEKSSFGMYAIYPHRKYLPLKVKAFIGFLEQYYHEI